MAGVSSRIGTFGLAAQSAKGSAAASPTSSFFFAGSPSLSPVKETARYTMTDSGRDLQGSFTSAYRVEGDVPLYLHPQNIGILFYGALGANADTGTTNYTHTITPADDLPYMTMWRMVGNEIIEKFVDCKINTLTLAGNPGQPLLATLGVIGITSTFEASDAITGMVTDTPYTYMDSTGTFKFDTVAKATSNMTLTISNGVAPYMADNYYPSDVDPGGREITLGFTTRFTGATDHPGYRQFFYGSAVGTAMSPIIDTHAAEVTFTKDANTSLKIEIPELSYAAFPVNPDPGGAPLEVSITGAVEKPASGDIITVTVEDQNSTVD